MKEKAGTVSALFRFMMKRKKYWMIPVVLILILVAVLLFVFSNTAITPFIYTIF